MLVQSMSAAMIGLGTIKIADGAGPLASATLASLLTAAGVSDATLLSLKHVDIDVLTGPVYIENDGTDADADTREFSSGSTWQIRNCAQMILTQVTVYAAGAYDLRVVMFK